jgi:hypothetical protein
MLRLSLSLREQAHQEVAHPTVLGLRAQYLPSPTARYYTVPAGMALFEVAQLVYGDASRVGVLLGANSVSDPLLLAPGRVILVPSIPAS